VIAEIAQQSRQVERDKSPQAALFDARQGQHLLSTRRVMRSTSASISAIVSSKAARRAGASAPG